MPAYRAISRAAPLVALAVLCVQPAQARFLQTDPVGYHDDLNDYLYTHDDPTDMTDPSGMVELDMISGKAEAESDPEIVRAASVFTLGPKYFTVLAHGNQDGLLDLRSGKMINSAKTLYGLMIAGGYKPGQIPVFLSCNLANSSIPQGLAEITHTPVYAANGYSDENETDRAGVWSSSIRSVEFDSHSGRHGQGERKSYHAFSPAGSNMHAADIDSMIVNTETGMATIRFNAQTGSRIKPRDVSVCVDAQRCNARSGKK